jgi:hypothetical protein
VGLVVGLSSVATAQHLDFDWAAGFGGASNDSAVATTDASGNVYVTGLFFGTVDFDPGNGVVELIGGDSNRYFCKFDSGGNLVYAVMVRTNNGTIALAGEIAADAAVGMYAVGSYQGNADFDPGPDITPLFCTGSNCGFVLRLDAFGEFDFAVSLSGLGATLSASQMAIDSAGDVVIAGQFRGTVDFDPGAGVFELTSQAAAPAELDMFVVKLDAAGNFVFARAVGGTGANATNSALTTDASGAIYAAGAFRGTVDFDPGGATANRTASGLSSGYVLKLDAAGDFVFAVANGGTGTDSPECIAVDSAGDIYLGGHYQGEVDFDPGVGMALQSSNAGTTDAYVQKLGAAGGFDFVRTIGGPRFDQILAGTLDSNDNFFLGGLFEDVVDFDPGPGERILVSISEEETGFVVVLNPLGELVSVEAITGDDEVGVNGGVALGVGGTAVVSGQFRGTMDGDPAISGDRIDSAGAVDGFVLSLVPNRRIFRTPESGFIVEGDRVELFALIGANYQWSKDAMLLAADPPRVTGVNTNRLVIASALVSDSGVYRVQYDDGAKAISLSDPLVLTVVPLGALPVGGIGWLAVGIVLLSGLGCLARYRRQSFPHS